MNRKLTLLFALVLAFSVFTTSTALAQDDVEKVVFCGELSEDDCALLTASQDSMTNLTSGATESQKEIFFGGFSGIPFDQAGVGVITSYVFVADEATVQRIQELRETDPAEVANDPDLLAETMLLPFQVDSANSTRILLASELSDFFANSLGLDLPGEVNYETRQIDGIFYINVSDFAQWVPQITALGDWIGIDMLAFMPMAIEKTIADGKLGEEEVAAMLQELQTPGEQMASSYLVMVEPDQAALYDDFLEIIPMRDANVNGEEVAVYRMRMDLGRYLGSPVFAQRLQAMMGDGEESAAGIVSTVLSIAAPMIFDGFDARVTQGIGKENTYVYGVDMPISWTFGSSSDPAGTTGIGLSILAQNSNFDSLSELPIPRDAFVPPLRLIMGLIEGLR